MNSAIVKKMQDEFSYLDVHLKKLTKKSEIERFKYYVKKRISLYSRLLKQESNRAPFSKSAMSFVKKISKRLDSPLTKMTKLFRKSDENITKYLQRSHVSRNFDKNSKGVFEEESALKKRTLIHLKRYLAKIPPTNMKELVAFKELFEDRAKADKLQNGNQNVENIKNTLEFRINKRSQFTTSFQMKKMAKNEAKRHYKVVRNHDAAVKLQSVQRGKTGRHRASDKAKLAAFSRRVDEMVRLRDEERLQETKKEKNN